MGCSAKGVGGEAESLWGHVLIRRILGLATRAYAAQGESPWRRLPRRNRSHQPRVAVEPRKV